MKKILFILPSLAVGGLERVQVSIANALVKSGHDVTVLALEPIFDLASELDERVRLIHKPYKPHHIMKKIPYIRHRFYDDGMWETRASAKRLYRYYVGKENYDVEIGFFRGLPVKIISGSTNKKSVKIAWVHNDFQICEGVFNNFKNKQATAAAYRKCDRVVCVSKQAQNSFEQVMGFAHNTTTVYNILDTTRIIEKASESTAIQKKRFTVVSVGRLVPAKGYDRLLGAIERLNNEGVEFDFWLVGDGAQKDELEKIVKAGKINNVYFLGRQMNPYAYVSQADLYVCSSRYEGYNLTVAEAMILGVPVVSTNCTGPCEILDNGNYGLIVDNSEEGLYQGLKALISDGEQLSKFKQKTIERQGFFDEENICRQIEQLFGV